MNQNMCMFVGRVANKPILKPYKRADGTEGYRCFFRLAVTRLMDRGAKREDQRANFIPIVSWGEPAKRHAQYLDVGTEICVTGELVVDAQRKEDGSFGPDFWNVSARDIQYGQASLKNAGLDVLTARKTSLEDRIATIQAGLNATPAPTETPVSTPVQGATPFQTEGDAPAESA